MTTTSFCCLHCSRANLASTVVLRPCILSRFQLIWFHAVYQLWAWNNVHIDIDIWQIGAVLVLLTALAAKEEH